MDLSFSNIQAKPMVLRPLLVGCFTSCIVIGRADQIAASVDLAASTPFMHTKTEVQNSLEAAGRFFTQRRISQGLKLLAILGVPLEIEAARRLLEAHKQRLGQVTDEEEEQVEEPQRKSALSHHVLCSQGQAPKAPLSQPSYTWMIALAATLSSVTLIVGFAGLALVARRRKVASRKGREQRIVEISLPSRGRRWGRSITVPPRQQEDEEESSSGLSGSDGEMPARSVTDTQFHSNASTPRSTRSNDPEQLRMAAIARHLKISGLDKRPLTPVGVKTKAIGVVKDRCDSINESIQRQQSVEAPELTCVTRTGSESGKISELQRNYDARNPMRAATIQPAQFGAFTGRRSQRASTAPSRDMSPTLSAKSEPVTRSPSLQQLTPHTPIGAQSMGRLIAG